MIYFIQQETTNYIKIGYARDPNQRLIQLRTASPYKLVLLGIMDGGTQTEDEIHSLFNSSRVRGEWFSPSDDLLQYIKRNTARRSGANSDNSTTFRKQLRISQEQLDALEKLAAELNISGQRGTWFQALILHMADTTAAALPEMIAALEIVSACAAGGDWDELVQVIRPEWPEE